MAQQIHPTHEKMSRNEILLVEEFELFPNEKVRYNVELTRSGLTYFPQNGERTKKNEKYLHFGDVIGCRCRKSLEQKHSNKAYITIFAYPLKKKLFSDKWVRHKAHITFARSVDESFDANRKVVEKWRRVILHLCQQLPVRQKAPGPTFQQEDPVDVDVEKCPVPPKKRFLVLINPHSGPGKAMQIYQKQVAPMLDEADIQVKVIQTEHAGHGQEMMKSLIRKDFQGVVIVSGDGLIYEVINGLMNRADWQDAIKMPVGAIPGGSGNALSCSINYSAGESIESDIVLHSTFILIKHRIVPMDLVVVEQPSSRVFSFLSVTWGLLADIDYESEKYRAIGEARFTLQAIKRILNLRKYRARISFLPISEYIPKSSSNNNSKIKHIPHKTRRVSLQSLDDENEAIEAVQNRLRSKSVPSKLSRAQSSSMSQSGDSDIDEQLTDIADSNAIGDSINGVLHSPVNGEADNNVLFGPQSEEAETTPSSNGTSNRHNSIQQDGNRMKTKSSETAPSTLLPPLDEPVPDDWVTLDEEYVTCCATYQTHMGSDVIMAPNARFSDGIIHLCLIRAGVQKTDLLTLMSMLEKGTHIDFDSPYFEIVKVLAFRMEPEGTDGVIMVDGEKVEFGPLQAQVLPRLANLMAIQ